jgi:hypothetical protein
MGEYRMQEDRLKLVICALFYFSNLTTAETKSVDFNNDGKVNFKDFSIIGINWQVEDFNSAVDISGPEGESDGFLDFYDIYAFADDFLCYKYIMSSHRSNNEKLYIWQSYNGIAWYLKGDNPVYENPNLPHTAPDARFPNNLMNCVRDPSIMKYNSKYYISYTTNNLPYHYYGNTIGIACSNDLQNWEYITDVYCGSYSYTWAPEWFVDDDDSIHVFVSLSYKIYETHPTNSDFTQWSPPVLVGGNWGTSGNYMIDPFVIKISNIYYLWYKGPISPTYHNIEYATSSSLTSGYTIQGAGTWTNWNATGDIEAPCLIKIDENKWRIYFDRYVDHGIYYAESSDNFQTWTPKKLITSESFIPAHPTVIHFNE